MKSALAALNLAPATVSDVYFTGAITDPKKTDLAFSYLALDGTSHRYTTDFALHTTDDRWILVEVNACNRRDDPIDGEKGRKALALQELWIATPAASSATWPGRTAASRRGDVPNASRAARLL